MCGMSGRRAKRKNRLESAERKKRDKSFFFAQAEINTEDYGIEIETKKERECGIDGRDESCQSDKGVREIGQRSEWKSGKGERLDEKSAGFFLGGMLKVYFGQMFEPRKEPFVMRGGRWCG